MLPSAPPPVPPPQPAPEVIMLCPEEWRTTQGQRFRFRRGVNGRYYIFIITKCMTV